MRKGKKFLKNLNSNFNKNYLILNKITIANNFINDNKYLQIGTKNSLEKKIKAVIPRQKRDFIGDKELEKIIEWDNVKVLRTNNKEFKLNKIKIYQYKLCILLLSLSGGRISDLIPINFYNLKNLLEFNYIGLYVQKDKKHRRIFLKNSFLKEKIKFFYLLLLNELKNLDIDITSLKEIPLFFKLKPALNKKKLIILKKSTITNELNTILSAACKHLNITKKINTDDTFKTKKINQLEIKKYITSHSFRITKISFLIKRIGLYKTMQQIGHSYPNTTLLYNRKLK